jgi:hypothetical protein
VRVLGAEEGRAERDSAHRDWGAGAEVWASGSQCRGEVEGNRYGRGYERKNGEGRREERWWGVVVGHVEVVDARREEGRERECRGLGREQVVGEWRSLGRGEGVEWGSWM